MMGPIGVGNTQGMSHYGHPAAVVHTTASPEDADADADGGVGLVIAGVVVAPVVALIATGCIGYLIFVVIQTTTWPLWYPVGQLLSLGGVEGFETRDLGGVFDALGALASLLVVDGLVALGVVGLFLLLLDLLSPIAFVPDRIIAKVVSSGRFSFSALGLVIAVLLVWSAYTVFLLLFPA